VPNVNIQLSKKKAFLLMLGIYLAVIVMFVLPFRYYHKNNQTLQENNEILRSMLLDMEKLRAEREAEYAQNKLDTITSAMLFIQEAQIKDNSLRNLLVERAVYDYAKNALEYFNQEDYRHAYEDFTRALRHQRSNTTLLFYQMYALYLDTLRDNLDASAAAILQEGIASVERRGFRNGELLDFSADEMRRLLGDMAFNIEGRLKSKGTEDGDNQN
jgi:hypothetical protein